MVASYEDSFKKAILNPQQVVLVVEDVFESSEAQFVFPELSAFLSAQKTRFDSVPTADSALETHRVIVSTVILSLIPDSTFHGRFQSKDEHSESSDYQLLDRDSSSQSNQNFRKFLDPREAA